MHDPIQSLPPGSSVMASLLQRPNEWFVTVGWGPFETMAKHPDLSVALSRAAERMLEIKEEQCKAK